MPASGVRPPTARTAAGAPFRPRFPWLTADLQTVRNIVMRPRVDLSRGAHSDLWFPMEDGSGDALHGSLSVPAEAGGRPLVVLIHGLTGCHESFHVLTSARHLLADGYPVLRLNLRGAGPTLGRCAQQYHAGRTGDFAAVLARLPAELTGNGVVALGYSLGGNMLLKYLGEAGEGSGLLAAGSVSAPIDLAATSRRFHRRRNWPYQRYLMTRLKKDTLAARGGIDREFHGPIRRARTMVEFDDAYIAPRYGFASALDYYGRSSALPWLGAIRTPTLVVHALDDPWIDPAAYREFDWAGNPALTAAISARGGHVGFHDRAPMPWHDRLWLDFLGRNARAAWAGTAADA